MLWNSVTQRDVVKHELRVMSCELGAKSLKARVESWKARVEIKKCEFKSTSRKFESTSYKFESTSYVFESTSYEFESTSYEFESTRIIKSIKTQVNNLKSSSFPSIISPKLFGNSWRNLYVQFLMIISCFTFTLLDGYGWVSKH